MIRMSEEREYQIEKIVEALSDIASYLYNINCIMALRAGLIGLRPLTPEEKEISNEGSK
jgi:hypothetical protein